MALFLDRVSFTPTRADTSGTPDFAVTSSDDSDLEAALAESLRIAEQESKAQELSTQVPPTERGFEESKHEIRDESMSDADLKAALEESLLVSQQSNSVQG